MLEQILGYLERVSGLFGKVIDWVQFVAQKVFTLTEKWYGALALLALLCVGFLIRGIIRSFAKNPRTTIFFVVLFALLAAGWYAVYVLGTK